MIVPISLPFALMLVAAMYWPMTLAFALVIFALGWFVPARWAKIVCFVLAALLVADCLLAIHTD